MNGEKGHENMSIIGCNGLLIKKESPVSGFLSQMAEDLLQVSPPVSIADMQVPSEETRPLANWFQMFYSIPPWNEFAICPACKPRRDYGPNSTYSLAQTKITGSICPKCGLTLERFWSQERTESYLKELSEKNGHFAFSTAVKGVLSGWIIGYNLDQSSAKRFFAVEANLLYIDLIGVLPSARSLSSIHTMLMATNVTQPSVPSDLGFVIKEYRSSPLAPHATLLYLLAISQALFAGKRYIATRTHSNAKHVTRLLSRAGFIERGKSGDDPNRSYWLRELEVNASQE